MRKFKFIGGTDKVLDKKAFLEMEYGTVCIPVLSKGLPAHTSHTD